MSDDSCEMVAFWRRSRCEWQSQIYVICVSVHKNNWAINFKRIIDANRIFIGLEGNAHTPRTEWIKKKQTRRSGAKKMKMEKIDRFTPKQTYVV